MCGYREVTKWRSDKENNYKKKDKRKVQEVAQSQTAALPSHQEEEETDKTKQTPQITKQTPHMNHRRTRPATEEPPCND